MKLMDFFLTGNSTVPDETIAMQTQLDDEEDGTSIVFHRNRRPSIISKIGNTTMLMRRQDGSTGMFSKIGNDIFEF